MRLAEHCITAAGLTALAAVASVPVTRMLRFLAVFVGVVCLAGCAGAPVQEIERRLPAEPSRQLRAIAECDANGESRRTSTLRMACHRARGEPPAGARIHQGPPGRAGKPNATPPPPLRVRTASTPRMPRHRSPSQHCKGAHLSLDRSPSTVADLTVERVTRRFLVIGKVQGVFFRHSTRIEARKRGIRGSARNLPNGSVEVLAQGSAPAVGGHAAPVVARHGPSPASSMASSEVREVPRRRSSAGSARGF